jgi:triosephosphate isomerase
MRKKIVAGNWKMNLNRKAAFQLIETIDSLKFSNNVEVIIAPPSIYLESFLGKVKNFNISSQDVSANDNGAYTGEFSAAMLSSLSLKYSIVGHSERRLYHGETEEMIFNKAKQLLKSNMSPIYCCGELLEDRKSENHFKVVASQLQPLLDNLNSDELEKFIIAMSLYGQ